MWHEKDESLRSELLFNDFVDAFSFMKRVAELAELHQHHPNWCNVYNRVSIKLTTHDAGNRLTTKDYALAEAISELPGFKDAVQPCEP